MYLKKELYELIKKDESIFDFIQEGSLDGLWYWDLENPENEWMNARFWTVLGYNPDEMPHKSNAWQNIIDQDDLKIALDKVAKHLENPNYPYDQIVRYTHKNGSTVWIHCRGLAIRDENGKPIRMLGAHHDITEIKNAEFELLKAKEKAEENELFYRQTFEKSAVGVAHVKPDGHFIKMNESFCQIVGYTHDELLAMNFADITYPYDLKEEEFFIEKILNNEINTFSTEKRYIHKKGHIIWISLHSNVVRDNNNKVLFAIASIFDITDQIKLQTEVIAAKEKAEDNETQTKSMLQTAMDGFWIVDMEFRLIEANEMACKMLGYSYEKMLELRISDIDSIETEEQTQKRKLEIIEKGEARFESKHRHKNGETIDVDVSVKKHPAKNLMFVFIHDITERKQSEEALRKNEALKKKMVSNISDVIVIIDKNGINRYKSPNITKLFGWQPEELLGKNTWDSIHPDDVEAGQQFFGSILSEPNAVGTTEMRYKHKVGHYVWIEISVTNLLHDKDIQGILGNYRDITERKQAEEIKKELLKRYELISLHLPGVIYQFKLRTDGTFHFPYASHGIYKIYGVHPKDVEHDAANAFKAIHPDDLEQVSVSINHSAQTLTPWHDIYRVNQPSGKTIWVEGNSTPQKLKDGSIIWHGFIQIITERKQAEQALKESELKFRDLFENGPIGVAYHKMVYDANGKPIDYLFLDANEAYQELTGVDPRGKLVTEAFPGIENDTSDWIGVFGKVALTGETIRFETYLEANQRWYDCVSYQNKPDHFVAAFLEVTKRKKAETQLQQINENLIQKNAEIKFNNERLQSLLSISQYASNSIQELLDFALGEAIKLTKSKIGYIYFYNENTKQFILNTWSKGVMEECEVRNPQTVYGLDKTGCWGEAVRQRKPVVINDYKAENPIKKGTPQGHVQLEKFLTIPVIVDNEIVAVCGVANKTTDYDSSDIRQLTLLMDSVWKISERMALIKELTSAKEKAEESGGKLKEAQRIAHMGNWELNIETNELFWSDEIYRIFDCEPQEFNATYEAFLGFIHPDDREKVNSAYSNSLETRTGYQIEHRLITKNNQLKFVREKCTTIFNEQGKPLNSFGIVIDITEQKALEYELISAKEKAEESDRLKSAFLANMSHEIRTPMNGILGFTELLLEPDLSSEEKEQYINIVNQSGQRMLNTVNDIIEISKIEAGIVTVNLKEVDVQSCLDELIRFFNPEASKKGLTMTLKYEQPKTNTIISTDKNKLDSILTNLIKNAIKFTRSGTIEIGYETLVETHCNASLRFYVKDTGIGIPKHRQESIFKRFLQADLADSRIFEGSGLGLAITKSYVEMMGGKIWIESEEGIGSIFYFTLPLEGASTEQKAPKLESLIEKQGGTANQLKILLVEDDEISNLHLSIVLKNITSNILYAYNGTNAVEMAQSNPDIDVILMDIRIPGIDGFEATRQIREFNKNVVIIAQTAFANTGDREKTLAAGCNDYITKPVNKQDLLALIKKYTVH